MNIEFANRLVALRKQHGYSQEDLAAKLDVSRQAVSKWERAEASPDTDNLILLARLYGVSLDELLFSGAKPAVPYMQDAALAEPALAEPFRKVVTASVPEECGPDPGDDAGDAAVEVCPPHDGRNEKESRLKKFPYPVLVSILYLLMGFVGKWWHPGWLIFLTVPLFYTLPDQEGSWMKFPYPILAALLFLVLGFCWGLWHPGWIVFLTVPLYYFIVEAVEKR